MNTGQKSILRLWAVAVIAAMALGGCVHHELPAPRPMVDVMPGGLFGADAKPMDVAEFARRAGYVDYVLVGEAHTAACDHRVQADILEAMAAGGEAPVLGLEMVSIDLQPELDRFNAGEIGPDELDDALNWKKTWGHSYAVYKPLFTAARKLGAPLAALNVPKRVVRAVSMGGFPAVAPEDRALLPLSIIPATGEQADALREEFSRHSSVMDTKGAEDRVERFMRVQALWDTAMAENAVKAGNRYGRPVLIIAGSGHVTNGWGIAERLTALDRRGRVLSVMPWRGGETVDPAVADAFFYCGLSHTSRLGFVLEERGGEVVVVGVAPDTRADKAGFAKDDVIVKVLDMDADTLWVLHKGAIKAGREKTPLTFTVRRGEEIIELSVELTRDKPDADGDGGQ